MSETQGLSTSEVQARIREGKQNGVDEVRTKPIHRIVMENLLTPFNFLNAVLGALVLSVGSYKNALFLGVILLNTLIGTVQEIRAKKLIDQLSLITAPKAHVLRDGGKQSIAISEIVLDDWMLLQNGNQICADCIVRSGCCEVNESLITGESDPILKHVGDQLLSGSFLVSGDCMAQVEHVGKDNFAAKMTGDAKYLKHPDSELMLCTNRIIRTIGFVLIPVGILLFVKQMWTVDDYTNAIVSTVAALVGMIPEGLVLLTSVVLAVSVIRLARKKALVQELYSIEMLARVDTLCLDKTGTLTKGSMKVEEVLPLTKDDWHYHLASTLTALNEQNETAKALKQYCPDTVMREVCHAVPFSSARKWSGVSFADGTVVLGAAEFVLGAALSSLQSTIDTATAKGYRVLVLAISTAPIADQTLPASLTPIAFFCLSDELREGVGQTLAYFAEQSVAIKIISGDNAATVSQIAQKAGVPYADRAVDATTLKTKEAVMQAVNHYTVFGRVTPEQKLWLVQALKAEGHTVAMTGDGVNDVLALRESDCSIAMAAGSDAARTVSQIVLLDSDFSSMPHIVAEGRRSINNLQRSASLFLVKTFFSAIIGVLFVLLPFAYPLQPIQFTLISALTIGVPSFILALEPNRERITGRFLRNIITRALPGSLTMVCNVLMILLVSVWLGLTQAETSTLVVLLTGATGLLILFRVCRPMTPIHAVLWGCMTAGFILAYLIMPSFFSLVPLNSTLLLLLVCLLLFAFFMQALLYRIFGKTHPFTNKKSR